MRSTASKAADSRQPVAAAAGGSQAKALHDKLAKLGLHSIDDLVLHLPLRYEDETRITAIADLKPGQPAQVEARVRFAEVAYRPRRQLVCRIGDDSGELTLRFINFYPSQAKQLQPGVRLRLYGETREGFMGQEMVHPRYRLVAQDEPLPAALTPIYSTTAGLGQQPLRQAIDAAIARADLRDTLPEPLRRRFGLDPFAASVHLLHHPGPQVAVAQLHDRTHPAWRRIKFDELLAQQLSLRRAFLARRARNAPQLAAKGALGARLIEALPFRLTGAQQRAWTQIRTDLATPHPMQRLLQGDVGSGKTVVAALAALQAIESGFQAALMAPTEILAEQHYRKLAAWLEPLGVTMAWLASALKRSDRTRALADISAGQIQLVVGTHALIEEAVEFPRLGLAIVDEQHRFGVRQRLALREKASAASMPSSPHMLMMSATPIPRTLAMSYYADLDVSLLDELPPGRTPVLTKLFADTRRAAVSARVREACAAGRQAYWVCPLIEESEALQLQTALDTYERLRDEFADLRVGLIHGRLAPGEKSQVMEDFAAGKLHLLVATTVIEVGVDVPNASLMVIEHAERFGLAQLHQLRGRVGRGAAQATCVLLYQTPVSPAARARLKIIYEHQDGFEIARQDLLLRGPGEFIGNRQSGVPLLRFADLTRDEDLLEQARGTAEVLLHEHPDLAAAHLSRWLGERQEYLKA